MAILSGWVAYRVDSADEHSDEINSWDLRRAQSIEVSCPNCGIKYGLIVPVDTPEEAINDYAEVLSNALLRHCPNHQYSVRMRDV